MMAFTRPAVRASQALAENPHEIDENLWITAVEFRECVLGQFKHLGRHNRDRAGGACAPGNQRRMTSPPCRRASGVVPSACWRNTCNTPCRITKRLEPCSPCLNSI